MHDSISTIFNRKRTKPLHKGRPRVATPNQVSLLQSLPTEELNNRSDYAPVEVPISREKKRRLEQGLRQEQARYNLTSWLVCMFTVTVATSGIMFGVAAFNPEKVDKELLIHWTSIVFPAQLSLLSGAIGYYFGSKSKDE